MAISRKHLRKLRHNARGPSAFPKVIPLGGGRGRTQTQVCPSQRRLPPSRLAASCLALLLFLLFLLPPRGNHQASGGHPFLSASSFPHSGARALCLGPWGPGCGSLCLSWPQFPHLYNRRGASADLNDGEQATGSSGDALSPSAPGRRGPAATPAVRAPAAARARQPPHPQSCLLLTDNGPSWGAEGAEASRPLVKLGPPDCLPAGQWAL